MANPMQGLDPAEAKQRLVRFGANILDRARSRNGWQLLAELVREPMFMLLLAASGLYLLVGDLAEGGFLSLAAVATIGLVLFQEIRSEKALAALRSLAQPSARVIRAGLEVTIPAGELVPGDLLLVGEGQRLPADGRLIGGEVLTIDESALTGESAPVTRLPQSQDGPGGSRLDPDPVNTLDTARLSAGTMVVSGQGLVWVERTGAHTALGQIGVSLASIDRSPTPLQQATSRLVGWISALALVFCLIVVVAYGVLRGNWVEAGLAGITIAISLIPEEFPMVLAIFMALGAWRLAQQKVLVRRSAVIEALGGASVLCVDKTGTLTENRMTVARLWAKEQAIVPGSGDLPPDLAALMTTALAACAARPLDPMDRALWALAPAGHARPDPVQVWPMQTDRLAVVQAWGSSELGFWAAAKGAPEAIFALCRLNAEAVAGLEPTLQALAGEGLRVLAVASAPQQAALPGDPAAMRFLFCGFLGFLDPVRPEVPDAIATARRAGIKVVMITGDYPQTAMAIARQAGIDTETGSLTGEALAAFAPETLADQIGDVRVFARVQPKQKLALVEAFKRRGEVIAMTGDGVNDAPALQAAHIGIAMGLRGTDVAREAADIVLLDDGFAAIMVGIALGRRIFSNLRKALTYVVAIHVPIAGLALLPVVMGMPPLLYPLHIVLLELVIDPLCAVVFEAEPGDPLAMQKQPRPLGEPLFGARQILTALLQGLGTFGAVFGLYVWTLGHMSQGQGRAVAFIALILSNLVLALIDSAGRGLDMFGPHRRMFWLIGLGAVLALIASTQLGPLAQLFRFEPPSGLGLIAALATAALVGAWALVLRARA
jgi:Ca2+-transporting ATPase